MPRHKKLEQLGKLSRQTIEDVFKNFKPIEQIVDETPIKDELIYEEKKLNVPKEKELEDMIKDIIEMFPHLGDGIIN